MEKYHLRFFFEPASSCVWSANDAAQEKFGYAIEVDSLPISEDLKKILADLTEEYATYLNWDSPADPSLWSEEKKSRFIGSAHMAYERFAKELGESYEVKNELAGCV